MTRRHFQTTNSTMVEAALWARDAKNPAPHMALVTADEQTAARGRQGKAWSTFPNHSFAGTFILTENTGPHLPLLAAIALSRALNQLAPTIQPHLALKWPNDILLSPLHEAKGACPVAEREPAPLQNGVKGALAPLHTQCVIPGSTGHAGTEALNAHPARSLEPMASLSASNSNQNNKPLAQRSFLKLAGILVEQLNLPETNRPSTIDHRTYLMGIGLNLTPPKEIPEGFPGTFLSQSLPKNTIIPLEDFIKAATSCISEVLRLYGSLGWPALAGEYVRQCCTIGQTVTWHKSPEVTLTGLARGLDETGALELVDEAGGLHLIHSGDVIAQGRSR